MCPEGNNQRRNGELKKWLIVSSTNTDHDDDNLTWNSCTSCAANRVQFSLYRIFKSSVIDQSRSTVLQIRKWKICMNSASIKETIEYHFTRKHEHMLSQLKLIVSGRVHFCGLSWVVIMVRYQRSNCWLSLGDDNCSHKHTMIIRWKGWRNRDLIEMLWFAPLLWHTWNNY